MRVAVDANVPVYHFTGRSAECSRFLARCAKRELHGFMPAHIALELLHQLMLLEARVGGLATGSNLARRLSEKPATVRALQHAYRDFGLLERIGLTLLDTTRKTVERTSWFCLSYGLLANDAALLAAMEEQAIQALASADGKLQDVPPFRTFGVADLK